MHKLKEAFTAPRSANGFTVQSYSPPARATSRPAADYEFQRGCGGMNSADIAAREWKAEIDRMDREAKHCSVQSEELLPRTESVVRS